MMSNEYVGWHPTQKPIFLLERLILAYCNVGDVVVDCFSGSGSTAINAGRSFIGCEMSKDYYDGSLIRISNIATPVVL